MVVNKCSLLALATLTCLFISCCSVSQQSSNTKDNKIVEIRKKTIQNRQKTPTIKMPFMDSTTIDKRYGLLTSSFLDLGNGIVYDHKNDLLWLKDANYFIKQMNWNNADHACQTLQFVGLSGWRLPSTSELKKMYNSVYLNQETHPFINVEKGFYWSYEPAGSDSHYLVGIGTRYACYEKGEKTLIKDSKRCIVWPVRGSK